MADETPVTRVRATRMLFYNSMRIRPGVVFTLKNPAHFSAKTMEPVDEALPDDLEAAVAASPKVRDTLGGSKLKSKASLVPSKGTLHPDAGI